MGWLPNSTPILNEDVHSWLHCSRKTFPIFKIEVQHLEILYKLQAEKILFTSQPVVLSIPQEQFTQGDIPPTMTR